jgi:hypothetical protein
MLYEQIEPRVNRMETATITSRCVVIAAPRMCTLPSTTAGTERGAPPKIARIEPSITRMRPIARMNEPMRSRVYLAKPTW